MKKWFFIIGLLLLGSACTSKKTKTPALILLKSYSINIPEPSGLSFDKNSLWIVSDQNNSVYQTNLKGEILQKIKAKKQKDIEGITLVHDTIWLVSEEKRILFSIDTDGNLISKSKIKGIQKNKNKGLEGLSFDSNENVFVLLNEKHPTELLKISKEGKLISRFKLNFSHDISGIFADAVSKTYWVVSDESKLVYNITASGKLISKYKIPFHKGEGITIYNDTIFIVNDALNKLYLFKKP
jgi:uncharacterized protein YjiK